MDLSRIGLCSSKATGSPASSAATIHGSAGSRLHDLEGRRLVPGFIDCQVNGGGGVLLNDEPTIESVRRIVAAHRSFGTTGLLPTLITTDIDVMRAAIDAVRGAMLAGDSGVLGIHFEGPLLSPARPGVHDAARFRPLDTELVELISLDGLGSNVAHHCSGARSPGSHPRAHCAGHHSLRRAHRRRLRHCTCGPRSRCSGRHTLVQRHVAAAITGSGHGRRGAR